MTAHDLIACPACQIYHCSCRPCRRLPLFSFAKDPVTLVRNELAGSQVRSTS
jgi:hypothetical protein